MRGHIVKRSKDSYTVVVSLGRDPVTRKPKQHWQSVKGTKKDAERLLSETLNSLDKGGFVKPTAKTVAEFLNQWLKDYATDHVRPRTFQRYQGIIRCHLIPTLGSIPLTRLQPSHIQACHAKALQSRKDGKGGTLTAKSVLQHHRVLSEALSHALKMGLVARNVAQAVDPPKPVNREMRSLDSFGVQTFLEATKGTIYYPVFHLDVYTGLRRSEILGLRWRDVNLLMATLSVVQVLHRLPGGKTVFLEPKTAKGRRSVSLSPNAVLSLKAHREQQEMLRAMRGSALSEDDMVFSQPDGSPLKPDTVSHAFIAIARKAGLGAVRLHDLRHTHATLMLQQGVHPKIVQERLGHANIAITLV